MTKLIDLSHRKEATDLIVDSALVAIWYGFPEASRLLLAWMKHRTDESPSTMWTHALRDMRFENYEEAEKTLRALLEKDPKDAQALALLVSVLHVSGQVNASMAVAKSAEANAMDPSSLGLLERVSSLKGAAAAGSARQNAHSLGVMAG